MSVKGIRNMRFKKLFAGVAVATAAIGVGGGIAVAVWTVTGAGSGSGAAAVAQSLTVSASTPTGAGASLYPGGPAGEVQFQVANPNPFAVTITGVAWGTPVSTNTTNCASSNISLDAGAPTTVSILIPANAPLGTLYDIPGVLDLAHSAGNGCQGVSFDIPMTITATQQ
jgi:hypothetical protein